MLTQKHTHAHTYTLTCTSAVDRSGVFRYQITATPHSLQFTITILIVKYLMQFAYLHACLRKKNNSLAQYTDCQMQWFTELAKSLRKCSDVLILSKYHLIRCMQYKSSYRENVALQVNSIKYSHFCSFFNEDQFYILFVHFKSVL